AVWTEPPSSFICLQPDLCIKSFLWQSGTSSVSRLDNIFLLEETCGWRCSADKHLHQRSLDLSSSATSSVSPDELQVFPKNPRRYTSLNSQKLLCLYLGKRLIPNTKLKSGYDNITKAEIGRLRGAVGKKQCARKTKERKAGGALAQLRTSKPPIPTLFLAAHWITKRTCYI
ncbi:hypothetical protein GOODEAATRI_015955, partial [Goodea atripinnis]